MKTDLSRLLSPKSIAVIGGGEWCAAAITQLSRAGFSGDIWPVHPAGGTRNGLACYTSLNELPKEPDAAFIGVNRNATIQTVESLSKADAGGAVCFASGFAEVEDGCVLNDALLEAAGGMPILGPNCYGLINALDGAVIWPDQHGCRPVTSGVAIITQSSNIAINLTMQSRGLPIAYVVTSGNQARLSQADIAMGLLDDDRVTAIGFHIEGFKDLASWEMLARKAREKSIPLLALKTGRSEEAKRATVSHTASLAGAEAGSNALMTRLGIGQVRDVASFLEALKILHVQGPLPHNQIASISCSGGEAALAADLAKDSGLEFPSLTQTQQKGLSQTLGPKVALANPLDYHTYIWRDQRAMTAAFASMLEPHLALTLLIVDFPRSDICDPNDWDCAIEAALAAKQETGQPLAMVSSMSELLPEDVATRLMAGGVVPLNGLKDAMEAIAAVQVVEPLDAELPLLHPNVIPHAITLDEAEAKEALAAYGLKTPNSIKFSRGSPPIELEWTAALKGLGFAHKTENNAVALNLKTIDDVNEAASRMDAKTFLLEEMISDGVAELLVGVTLDPAHGYVLTIGAGGTLTELLQDAQSLLLPTNRMSMKQCLNRLKCAPLLHGYRGKPPADIDAILDAIEAVQAFVVDNPKDVAEVEINPLICTPTRAVAADALIRRRP